MMVMYFENTVLVNEEWQYNSTLVHCFDFGLLKHSSSLKSLFRCSTNSKTTRSSKKLRFHNLLEFDHQALR